jgi:hypothetical protein
MCAVENLHSPHLIGAEQSLDLRHGEYEIGKEGSKIVVQESPFSLSIPQFIALLLRTCPGSASTRHDPIGPRQHARDAKPGKIYSSPDDWRRESSC